MSRQEMRSDLLLVQVYHPQNMNIGDFIYRIEQPSRAMGKIHGVKVININIYSPYLKEVCLQADILILHMVSDQDMLPIIEERKRLGLPNVFEISDIFIGFQRRDPMREYFKDPLNLATILQYISLADAVQVTTEELLNTFSFVNSCFIVFENHIMSVGEFSKDRSGAITIGWGGSLSHLEDLEWIAPTIIKTCNAYPNVRFSYMGNKAGFKYFRDIPGAQKIYTSPGSLHDYYDFLETIDVGIAPLLNTEYNRCRSDIKFVEYASRGVAPVLSALPPYQKHALDGVNAFLFADENELFNVLVRLIKNPDLRLKVAKNAYKYVKEQRLECLRAPERVKFYHEMCETKPRKSLPDEILEHISSDSEAYFVKETMAERLSFRGLTLNNRGDVIGEWRLHKEAIKSMPEYHVPYFRLGESLFRHGKTEAIYYLDHANRLCAASLRTKLLLGLAFLNRDKQAAYRYFKDALEVSPMYAPAWDALGRMQEESGDYGKAIEFFNLALKANPFYGLASLGLGRAYLAMGKLNEALKALHIADDILPNHVESRLQLTKLFLKIEKFEEAVCQCKRILGEDPQNNAAQKLLAEISDRYVASV